MTKEEYYIFVEQNFKYMLDLIKKKNSDYSGPGSDPFTNFRRSEAVGVDPIRGLTVRLLDKVARIESYMKAGKLENEGIEDAFLDLIGYSCLALGMLKEQKDSNFTADSLVVTNSIANTATVIPNGLGVIKWP